MPQIVCPDCQFKANDTAKSCPRCGKLFAKTTASSPGSFDDYAPPSSIGACPACKSLNTYDVVKQSEEQLGYMGKVGASLGAKVSGHGRLRCNRCGHMWDKQS